MKLERWVEHPFSDTETWLVDGWFILAVDRREVIEMMAREYPDLILSKLAEPAFLSVPGHDPKRLDGSSSQ